MPATAGRVRMPANNRVHSSAALQTHGIWQTAIQYDPYAPRKDDTKDSSLQKPSPVDTEGENTYASFQGLLALARITGNNADEARGSCKKCGRVGHLTFQCRNFLSIKDDNKEKDPEAMQSVVLSELDKIKGTVKRAVESEEESEEEEDDSETSDSQVDSEIERIIAKRYGKKTSSKGRPSKELSDKDRLDSDSEKRKKRGRSKTRRSKKRTTSDSEDVDENRRKMRKEKRRKRYKSSDEEEERYHSKRKSRKEKRRRRSHRYSDDSDSEASEDSCGRHDRKSRIPSVSDVSGSDDSRVGRGAKRSDKKSRRRQH